MTAKKQRQSFTASHPHHDKNVRANPNELHFPEIIQMQQVSFRTFEEARSIAMHMSEWCPNPLQAQAGLNELFINAIEHGNLGITYEEKNQILKKNTWLSTVYGRLFMAENKTKRVRVCFIKTPDCIQIKIKDSGKGFNWKPYLSLQDNRRFNGRGIMIAKEYAFDDIAFNSLGNEVTCYIYR